MDSTFTAISEEGIHNKKQSLQGMYSNSSQRLKDSVFIDSFNLENTVVNIYDNAAVVIFTVHTYKKVKGKPIEKRTRFYDVWINRNGTWQAVSSQGTVIPE